MRWRNIAKDWKKIACHLFALLLLCTLLAFQITGCRDVSTISNSHQYGVTGLSLSPDNENIIFSLSQGAHGRADIATYNIRSGKLSTANPTDKDCLGAVYSRDGKRMTFASGDGDDKNIYFMNADGSGLRQLTHIRNNPKQQINGNAVVIINAVPSFSPDGKRILFKRSGVRRTRSMGGTMVSHWDFYEIDLISGKERQLSDHRFYIASRPFYLPDGKGFIFSGSGAKGAEIDDLEGNNLSSIMMMAGTSNRLKSAFNFDAWAGHSSVSHDGTIAFVSQTNVLDGTKGSYTYDVFIHRNGTIKRLTSMKFALVMELFISGDGSKIIFFASKSRNDGPSIWIVNGDGTDLREIGRPWKRLKNTL